MNVELMSYTPDALNLLLRTKGTRLAHEDDPAEWSPQRKAEHLQYMKDTIKSSWEFVDYVFKISGVTRAFTHQLVRTRTGSYAQEAMRVIDAREHEVVKPDSVIASGESSDDWNDSIERVMKTYGRMVDDHIPPQDARGILPTNITTSIIAKFNLRTLAATAELRLCTRTQGEYQEVFRAMKALVVEVHPWAEDFIQVFCANHVHCAFPQYGEKECPVYPAVLRNEAVVALRGAIRSRFNSVRHEASPIAKGGKTS